MERITGATTIVYLIIICTIIIAFGDKEGGFFSGSILAIKFILCGIILMIGGIFYTKKFLKTEKIIFEIESLPLLETDEAVAGVPFAGEGIIEPEDDKIILSPYTKTPCVYFHSIKEQHAGKNTWKIVENLAFFVPFYVRDKRGKLKVNLSNLDDDFSDYKLPQKNRNIPDPKNSEVDCEAVLEKSYEIVNKKFPIFKFSYPGYYRYSEFVLKPGTKVFVHGMISRDNGQLLLHEAENCPLIISKKNRDQYVKDFYQGENLVYLVHFLFSIGFTLFGLAINYFLKINPLLFLSLILIVNIFILGSAIFSIYNRIVTLKNRALNSLSNIDVELKRRNDLILNIVEVVKEYTKHESEIQRIITEARSKILFSKEMKNNEEKIIHSLVVIIENYPNLRASGQFQSLMKILIDTEERIAYSREFYNRTVRKYNTLIKQIPFNFIALILRIQEMEFIRIV